MNIARQPQGIAFHWLEEAFSHPNRAKEINAAEDSACWP